MAIGPRCLRCLMLMLSGPVELLFLLLFTAFLTCSVCYMLYGSVLRFLVYLFVILFRLFVVCALEFTNCLLKEVALCLCVTIVFLLKVIVLFVSCFCFLFESAWIVFHNICVFCLWSQFSLPSVVLLDGFHLSTLSVTLVQSMPCKIMIRTSTGIDELPPFLLKRLASLIAPNVARINSSLSICSFPALWKQAIVCPIYKGKGNMSDSSNYRSYHPISILPVLVRALERAVASQLGSDRDNRGIIPRPQFCFRRGSSCELALLNAL